MILEIKKYPNSILKSKCREIKKITPETKELAFNIVETMIKKGGIGLAAPQVGESKRIIVVMTEKGMIEVFINPRIVNKDKKKEIMEEGCLSFPGLFLKIKRVKKIEVEFIDLQGEKSVIKAEGLLARVFQHEIDHLNGILFIERIPFWQRFKLKLVK
jgi:peptide deformylase